MRTCRAVVFDGKRGVELREFPVPDVPDGGAVLRVEALGLCASDLAQFRGLHNTPAATFPVVPGHEIVGRIDRISGSAAEAWGVDAGDRVAVDEAIVCGRCSGCRDETLCEQLLVYGHDFSADKPPGLFGGYGEYMALLPDTTVYRLPDGVPAEELTLFEPLANALFWTRPVVGSDTVVIQGPGHLGLCCVISARAAGAASIIVTGTGADGLRLETARRIGATATVNVDAEDPVERVRELTSGRMADVVMDVAAHVTKTVNLCLDLVRNRGRIVLAGLKDFQPVEGLVTDWIALRGLTIHGGGGLDVKAAVDLLRAGRVPTAELKGEVFPLEGVEEALQLLDRAIPGRDAVRVGLKLSS
jgi:threonine dehydrogenase-like Zn-dependent dehydrogenase